jgi:hypothetical protein
MARRRICVLRKANALLHAPLVVLAQRQIHAPEAVGIVALADERYARIGWHVGHGLA